MKKLRLLSIIILVAGALLINSCSKPEQHLKTIPSTAKLVGSVDLMGLAMKADLSDPSQYGFYNDMMNELKGEKPEIHAMVEEMMNNPMKTGIKYREDLYFFLQDYEGKDIVALALSLRSGDKFGKFLGDMSKMAEGIEFTLEDKDGVHFFYNNDMTIAWDKARAVIIPENAYLEENGKPFILGLFDQGDSESILSTEYFGAFKTNRKDLSIMMEPTKLMGNPQMAAMIKSQMPVNMDGNMMNIHFGFEKEEIVLKLQWFYNEELKEMMSEYKFIKDEFNKDLLKYLPKENYMTMAVAINPEEYYNWINTIPSYKSMLSGVDANMPLKIDEVVKALKGDILIGLHGLDVQIDESGSDPEGHAKEHKKLSATGTIVLSLNDPELYNKITTQIIPPGMFKEENGYFHGEIMGEPLYYGLFDNNIIVTMDKKVIENAPNGGFDESLADNDAAKILKYPAAIYMNLLWDTYPEMFQKVASEEMGNSQFEAFQALTNVLQEIDAYTVDNENSEVHVKMRNTDKNSLHTILLLIDENRKNI